MKYRPEIDGLRAIAVLPVILFHAGFEVFSGGYVGVDVFFVISGYLITSIILKEMTDSSFSLVRFYGRRARRILPALFFVMACCIPFAWMWMLPPQFEDFSESLIATTLFVSNIHFWQESGYFAAAAEEKPLLHTWSLAVEEQYYLIFPIFLIIAWRFGRNPTFYLIAMIALISLAISDWGARNAPSANFYLAPTRAWELLAGSLCAFLLQPGAALHARPGAGARSLALMRDNVLAALGLGLILTAIFCYEQTTPFPSVYALVPVGGAVLIVLFARPETVVARLLSLPLLVGIGLISYSAYLWHQPLFAFARIRSLTPPEPWLMLILAATSLGLAYLSWRFVEKPFRRRSDGSRISGRISALIAVASTIAFLSAASLGVITGGIPHRFDELVISYARSADDFSEKGAACLEYQGGLSRATPQCVVGAGTKTFIVWGDSHAAAIIPAFEYGAQEMGEGGLLFAKNSCPPIQGSARKAAHQKARNSCINRNRDVLEYIRQSPNIEKVFLVANWEGYIGGAFVPAIGSEEFEQPDVLSKTFLSGLENSIAALNELGVEVIVLYDLPTPGFNSPKKFSRLKMSGEEIPRYFSYSDLGSSGSLAGTCGNGDVKCVRLSHYLCEQKKCALFVDHAIAFVDGNHLSSNAAKLGSGPISL